MEGLEQVLDTMPEIEVVATCADLDSLLDAVETENPDVVVTDIRMPPNGSDEGIRAAALLRESHPEIGVVVFSQHDEPAYALALLESGRKAAHTCSRNACTTAAQLGQQSRRSRAAAP